MKMEKVKEWISEYQAMNEKEWASVYHGFGYPEYQKSFDILKK